MASTERRNAVNVYITPVTIDNYSRNDYLKWVNDMLQMRLTKIEQLSTGEVYCQFMEMLFPGCCPCSKIIFNPSMEVEYTQNFRYLQNAFRFVKVDKVVPIDRLIKGKYMDNFDFLQWFRKFVDANYDGEPYDALGARGGVQVPKTASTGRNAGGKITPGSSIDGGPGGTPKKTALVSPITRQYHHTGKVVSYNKSHANAGAGSSSSASSTKRPPSSSSSSSARHRVTNGGIKAANGSSHPPPPSSASSSSTSGAKRRPVSSANRRPVSSSSSNSPPSVPLQSASAGASNNNNSQTAAKVAELKSKLSDLKVGKQELEKERNFYMSKLTEIETICQSHEPTTREDEDEEEAGEKTPLDELVAAVLEIMYATDEEFAEGDELQEGDEGEEGEFVDGEEESPLQEAAVTNESDEEY